MNALMISKFTKCIDLIKFAEDKIVMLKNLVNNYALGDPTFQHRPCIRYFDLPFYADSGNM